MDELERELREEIFEKVRQLYQHRKSKERFIPGQSPISYAGRIYDEKEMISLVDSSLDFWLTLGRYGQQFERDIANFLGAKYAVLANSGSSANLLAISALISPHLGERRLKTGDEVITVATSFPTTVNPIIQNQLVPVFVDVEIGTYNVDVTEVEKALNEKTKAVCVAHTMGNPFDIDALLDLVQRYKLFLIEDACDAFGSTYKGKCVGTFGDMATLSFYPAHHITTGEGGAVIMNSIEFKRIVTSMRDWGRDCWCGSGEDNTCGKRFGWQLGELPFGYDHKYVYSHIGYNLKPVDMQSAIGVEQMKKLPEFIRRRRENFSLLYDALKKYEKYLILPIPTAHSEPSWFGFIISVRPDAPFTRNQIVSYLEMARIATRSLFAGNILRHPAYHDITYRIQGELKNSDFIMHNTFWIGIYPGLDDEKITYVLNVFESFMKHYAK